MCVVGMLIYLRDFHLTVGRLNAFWVGKQRRGVKAPLICLFFSTNAILLTFSCVQYWLIICFHIQNKRI